MMQLEIIKGRTGVNLLSKKRKARSKQAFKQGAQRVCGYFLLLSRAAQTAAAPASDGRSRQAASFPASKKHTSYSMPSSVIYGMLPSADRLCKGLSADFLREFSTMRVSGRHPQFQRQGVNETPCAIKFSQNFYFLVIHPAVFSGGIVRGLRRSREPLLATLPKAVR